MENVNQTDSPNVNGEGTVLGGPAGAPNKNTKKWVMVAVFLTAIALIVVAVKFL